MWPAKEGYVHTHKWAGVSLYWASWVSKLPWFMYFFLATRVTKNHSAMMMRMRFHMAEET